MDTTSCIQTPQYAVAGIFKTHADGMGDTLYDMMSQLNRMQSFLDRMCEETERPERYLVTIQKRTYADGPDSPLPTKTLWNLSIHRMAEIGTAIALTGLMMATPSKNDPTVFAWYPEKGQLLSFSSREKPESLRQNLETVWALLKDAPSVARTPVHRHVAVA